MGKRKRNFLLILLLLLAVLLVVLLLPWNRAASSPITVPEDAVSLTSPADGELLTDVRQWNMPQLLQHEVYLLDGWLHVEFWFDPSADPGQVDRARAWALEAFVLRHSQWLGPYPYASLVQDADLEWDGVTCKVYQGRKLVAEDVYDHIYAGLLP